MVRAVDRAKRPSEDFASVTIECKTANGHWVIGEAPTRWSFVVSGLRLSSKPFRPEYSGPK